MRSAAESISLVPERSTDPLEQVDYRLAITPQEKDNIYRLRYRAYLREGAILPSESERVIDRYDDSPNAWTFGIYIHGELFSSIRVSVLTSRWRGSPSSEMFADILHPELDRGRIVIDPTRFVADPEKAKRFPELPYVKVFLQEPLGEPRLFPGLIKPVGLMAAHYPSIREKVFQRFPFMRSTAFERRMLFERKGSTLSAVSPFERNSIISLQS